jgi:hypothetical protein
LLIAACLANFSSAGNGSQFVLLCWQEAVEVEHRDGSNQAHCFDGGRSAFVPHALPHTPRVWVCVPTLNLVPSSRNERRVLRAGTASGAVRFEPYFWERGGGVLDYQV